MLEFAIWALAPGQDERLYACCTTGAGSPGDDIVAWPGVANAVAIDTSVAPAKVGQTLQIPIPDKKIEILPPPR